MMNNKLIHKDNEFIKNYSNALVKSAMIRELSNELSTEETILEGCKSLNKVFKILLEESKTQIDYQNYIRWSLKFSFKYISSTFVGLGEEFEEKLKLSKELEKRYEEIMYKHSGKISSSGLKTIINEARNMSKKIDRLIENPIISRLLKKSIEQFLNYLSNIFENWPYYPYLVNENEMKSFYENAFIFLHKSGLDSEKTKVTNLYYATIEKVECELKLGEKQDECIRLAILAHLEFQRKSHYSQIVARCGEYYEMLKGEMNRLKSSAYSFGSLVVAPFKSPLVFLENLRYAVNNIGAVTKEIWSHVKENPIKSISFVIGSAAVGCLIGWLSTALVTSSLAFAVGDIVVASCVGLFCGTSVVANAASNVNNQIHKIVDNDIAIRIKRTNAHQNAMNAAKKTYYKELYKSYIKEGIQPEDGEIQFNENDSKEDFEKKLNLQKLIVTSYTNEVLESKEKASEIVGEASANIEAFEKKISQKESQQEIEMENLKKIDEKIKENSNLNNHHSNEIEKSKVMPLFTKWITKFSIDGNDSKMLYISQMMAVGKYNELFNHLQYLEMCENEEFVDVINSL